MATDTYQNWNPKIARRLAKRPSKNRMRKLMKQARELFGGN